jgi:hypothetical protein
MTYGENLDQTIAECDCPDPVVCRGWGGCRAAELPEPRRSPLTDEALRGLDAIYREAWQQGRRTGFGAGVGEKAWLHKTWPGFGILLFVVGTLFGIFVGANL